MVDIPQGKIGYTFFLPKNAKYAGKISGAGPLMVPNSNKIYHVWSSLGSLRMARRDNPNIIKLPQGYDSFRDSYQIQGDLVDLLRDDGVHLHMKSSVNVSPNGKWAASTTGTMFVRINLETFEITPFSYYGGTNVRVYISNDGNYAYSDSYAYGSRTMKIHNLTGCAPNPTNQQVVVPGCLEKDIKPFFNSSGYESASEAVFSHDGKQVSLTVDSPTIEPTRVTFTAAGYTPASLDYLALGDSISSGEGDTEKVNGQKFYRPLTDINGDKSNGIPREKCHVSTRSYPYRLANWMQLSNDWWGSVACSGAKIYDVNSNNIHGYEGQYSGDSETLGYGRLNGLSNKEALQAQALNEIIPGRKKQIEFVEKYKPKVITLTMGANDIDFGKKIESCIYFGTCDWAVFKKDTLGRQIRGQFIKLVELYSELKRVGNPSAKMYIIGYPQLISDANPASCGYNVGFMNIEEREVVAQATEYMNSVIEAAAKRTGLKYVDISDALYEGRLCDQGQAYVTGITHPDFRQESYHPNSPGHQKIAQRIIQELNNESLLTYSQYPTSEDPTAEVPVSPHFIDTDDIVSIDAPISDNETITKSGTANILTDQYLLMPGSNARVEIHSEPVVLGNFTVNNDGTLTETVAIPADLPVGYHTLYISGHNLADEPIEITQTVLVVGSDPNDIDENGIPDSQQVCGLFIDASGQDTDYDGIDDACDPEITEPVLYTARNGDIAKGENAGSLYLYRNTRASSMTGITDDHVDISSDPNNKEALIAQSLNPQSIGTLTKLAMIEDMNNPAIQIPTILAKDTTGTCFALQPNDLSPALDPTDPNYMPRGFTRLTQLPEGEGCE